MDGTRFGGVENPDAKLIGQGRSVPELEQRPEQGHHEQDDLCRTAARGAATGVGLGDESGKFIGTGSTYRFWR